MDLRKYVPRAQAAAMIAASQERAETAEEAISIQQEEVLEAEKRALAAESQIAAAEERAKAAEARAVAKEIDCETAEAEAEKERDLRSKAEKAEADVRADLKIAQATATTAKDEYAECARELKAAKVTIEQQKQYLNEAIVKAATEERLRLVAERKPRKTVSVPAPAMSPMSYVVEEFRRDSNGDLRSFSLTPKKAH